MNENTLCDLAAFKVIAELTQAVMKSKNVTTLTRAMNHPHKISTTSTLSTDIESQLGASNSDLSRKSSGDGGGKLRRSIRALKRGSGIEAVKDLWQQTGKCA